MIVTDSQIKAFENFIDTYDSFFISGHKDPDGDSVASCLGVAEILKAKNKSFQLISVGPFRKTEVKKYEKLFSSTLKKKFLTSSKTAFIQVDCSEIERIGNGFCDELKGFPTFIIDHHKTSVLSPEESKNAIIYGDSPAAVFLVQQLYEKIIGKPNKELAQILFFGLCTDTGFFKFLNENSSVVFDAASRLVSCGVNPREIYTKINSGKPFTTRKLLGITLERSVQFYKGKLIVTYETLDDMQELAKNGRDTDSLYDLLLSVEGVKAVAFVRQESETNCTVGLRSKDEVDVSFVAQKLGGGGHKNAAGLSIEGKFTDIIEKIIAEFEPII